MVHLAGDIDLASGPSVMERLVRTAGDQVDVVADLSHVTFIDCAGLRSLIGVQDLIPGRLWLRSPSRPVTWLMSITDTWRRFERLHHDEPALPQPGSVATR